MSRHHPDAAAGSRGMTAIATCCSSAAVARPAIISGAARKMTVDCCLESCGVWLSWSVARTLHSFVAACGGASQAAVADFAAGS